MSESEVLRREFATLARYLGVTVDLSAIAPRYVAMHSSVKAVLPTPWDETLVRFARAGVVAAALADSYACLTTPHGLLRRKLVLALALLESAPSTHDQFDSARPSARPSALLALMGLVTMWAIRTVCGVVLLAPTHALTSLVTSRAGRG